MAERKLSIRPFEPSDLAQVCSIETESFTDPWPKADFLQLRPPDHIFYVACEDGRVVGYIVVRIEKRNIQHVAHLLNLAVVFCHRRRGIGAALLESVENLLSAQRIERIELEVRQRNQGARSFYLCQGFKEEGVIPLYYSNEDAVIMRKRVD